MRLGDLLGIKGLDESLHVAGALLTALHDDGTRAWSRSEIRVRFDEPTVVPEAVEVRASCFDHGRDLRGQRQESLVLVFGWGGAIFVSCGARRTAV